MTEMLERWIARRSGTRARSASSSTPPGRGPRLVAAARAPLVGTRVWRRSPLLARRWCSWRPAPPRWPPRACCSAAPRSLCRAGSRCSRAAGWACRCPAARGDHLAGERSCRRPALGGTVHRHDPRLRMPAVRSRRARRARSHRPGRRVLKRWPLSRPSARLSAGPFPCGPSMPWPSVRGRVHGRHTRQRAVVEQSCSAPGRLSHRRRPSAPQRDERLVMAGMAGPLARTITYADPSGQLHTVSTVGAQGAYLIVDRAPAKLGLEGGGV